ncbi:MAG: adenylate/guanylate cyclase domain-containing protein [Verrucomicrobia bacterium]|nr:adenylate/guanylate cyclase domain-containing protein [Verrucomicrobiota bacterium]
MSRISKLKQNWLGGGIGVLLAVGLGAGLLVFNSSLGKKLKHLSYDLPFAIRPVAKPQAVVMVYMDDDSHKELNQPFNQPWDRSWHAQLLNRLTAEGARAVVFDIVFSNPGTNPENDEQLTQAIRAQGKVVLAADYVATGYGRDGVAMKTIVPPHQPFSEAAAELGSAETNPDDDLVIRKHVPMSGDDLLPTLSWAAAKLIGAEVAKDEKNRFQERWMNYYGPPATIPNVSFYRAILPGDLPSGFFSNKVVFVGARLLTKFSGDRKDEYPTPYSSLSPKNPFMPGVEIQATAFLNLLHGNWLNRPSPKVELAVILLAGIAFGYGLSLFRPLTASSFALLAILVVTLIAHFLFSRQRIWFPWMIIVAAQIPVALLWSVVFNSVRLYVQNKLYEQTLSFYLSPKLVKKFSTDRELLKVGAKQQTLTVLFTDIANFTSISERMDSNDLALHMNKYFETAVSKCIHHTDGTIVKYLGDAIFSFWNAPDPQLDHQLRACEAALRFREQPPQYMNGQLLITRIGLHTGVANVGNFGSTARVDYTALGENINLASRMEGLNKYLGTEVLITGETQAGIDGRLVTRALGRFQLKGFAKSVDVYELVGPPEKAEATRPMREAFAEALKLFRNGNFARAETTFRRVLDFAPKDGPTLFFLRQIDHFRETPPPPQWKGEVELKEK